MEDKELVCKDCNNAFVLTVNEQNWYAEKGFAEPKRCLSCRQAKRTRIERKENE